MDNKEIIERATRALFLVEKSKPNEVDNYDLLCKINETLRLIIALAEKNVQSSSSI